MGRNSPPRDPRKKPPPLNPPRKFCPECGWENGTGHGPQCSRK